MKKFFILFISIVFFMHLVSCGGYLGYNRGLDSREDSSKDETSYLSLTSHAEGVSVSSFEEVFSGTCDDSYSFNVSSNSSALTIVSSSCSGSSLEVVAGFKATYGSNDSRSFTITNGDELLTRAVNFRLDCPSGFIGVSRRFGKIV